jgi:hypothetical protein
MPRRTSARTIIDDSEEETHQTQLRRSGRNTTARDKGHLNYDLKYHPADDELRPANARRRKQAHGIPVSDPAVRRTIESGSDVDDDDDNSTILISSDDGSGNYAGRGGQKRSRTSSSGAAKRRKTNGFEGQRCSTMKDIEKITKRYEEAWATVVHSLPTADAFQLRATQYENAWEELATQVQSKGPEAMVLDDDDEESVGDIRHDLGRANGEDNLSQHNAFKPMSTSTQRVPAIRSQVSTLQKPSLFTPLDDEIFGLTSQVSRSSPGIQSSFQDHLLDQEDVETEVAAPPVRSITPPERGFTPATSIRTTTPRSSRQHASIIVHEDIVHEDNATQWLERTRVSHNSDIYENPKENLAEEEVEDHDGATTTMHATIAKTTPRRLVTTTLGPMTQRVSGQVHQDGQSGSESGNESTSEESEHDGDDAEEDDDEDAEEEEDDDDRVKNEPMSSAAAKKRRSD